MDQLEALTKSYVNEYLEAQENYLEEVEEYRQMGYRPRYCIHGTSMWTDYDNICRGCEEGIFTEYSTREEIEVLAKEQAETEINRRNKE